MHTTWIIFVLVQLGECHDRSGANELEKFNKDRQRPELRKMTFGCKTDNRIEIKERKGDQDKNIEQGCEKKDKKGVQR